jgi:hypothetical protein
VRIAKIILLVVAIIIVVIQFIRPGKNLGPADPSKEIASVINVPGDVSAILRKSCYDCHSDSTRYPWYSEVMPVGWFLAGHVNDAKTRLNFSEFGSGSLRRQYKKLEEISEQIGQGEMPLDSYLLMHGDAALAPGEKEALNRWVEASRASMRERHPDENFGGKESGGRKEEVKKADTVKAGGKEEEKDEEKERN